MLGGEVYVGFPFAEQLDRIAVFVFTEFINPVTFRAKAEMIGDHHAFSVIKCFVSDKQCTFRAVDGVLLDEFVVQQLSHLADEDSEYFEKLLNQKASDIFSSSQNEKELSDLRKKKAQLETAIANQVKNLREADDSLKRFIQEDVKAIPMNLPK